MLYDGKKIVGYIAVSICKCQNINKHVYKFAVKCENGNFLTLFFLEDNITEAIYYPLGCQDKWIHELICNNGFASLKKDYWENYELMSSEERQKPMPILEERFFSVFPKRMEDESQEAFDERMQTAIKKKQFLDEYFAFVKNKKEK